MRSVLILATLAGCCHTTPAPWFPAPEDRDLTECYWQDDSPEEAPPTHHWTGIVFEDVSEDYVTYYVCKGDKDAR